MIKSIERVRHCPVVSPCWPERVFQYSQFFIHHGQGRESVMPVCSLELEQF